MSRKWIIRLDQSAPVLNKKNHAKIIKSTLLTSWHSYVWNWPWYNLIEILPAAVCSWDLMNPSLHQKNSEFRVFFFSQDVSRLKASIVVHLLVHRKCCSCLVSWGHSYGITVLFEIIGLSCEHRDMIFIADKSCIVLILILLKQCLFF